MDDEVIWLSVDWSKNDKQISDETGFEKEIVKWARNDYAPKPKKVRKSRAKAKPRPAISDEIKSQMIDLVQYGFKREWIAKEYGFSYNSVSLALVGFRKKVHSKPKKLRPVITEELKSQMIDLLRYGFKRDWIAEQYGFSGNSVRLALVGVRKKPLSKEERQRRWRVRAKEHYKKNRDRVLAKRKSDYEKKKADKDLLKPRRRVPKERKL